MVGVFERLGEKSLGQLLDTIEADQKALARQKKRQKKQAMGDLADDAAEEGNKENRVDAPVAFGLLSMPGGEQGEHVDQMALTLSQAIEGAQKSGDAYATSKLKKVRAAVF